MRKRTGVIVIGALGLLLGGLFVVWSRDDGERAARPGAIAPRDEAALRGELEAPNAAENSSHERNETATGVHANAPNDPAMVDERLRGRVLDAAGAPIVGAQVDVQHAPSDSFNTHDPSFHHAVSRVASVVTGARGEFAVEVANGQLFQLVVSSGGYGPARVPHCKAAEVVEVRLQRGATLFGVVVHRADKSPVAGAVVAVSPRPSDGQLSALGARSEAVTDDAGRYRIEGLAPGVYFGSVAHTGLASPS